MLSEDQKFEQLRKLFLILEALPSCENIGEISEKTNIPTSTIQRYLNDESKFIDLYAQESDEVSKLAKAQLTYEKVQAYLKKAKANGHSKGGKNSQLLHGYDKDEQGRFKGGRR